MSSLAASSSLFGLPRAVSAAAGPSSSTSLRRSFSRSSAVQAPYKTSTGQVAILPVFVPKRPGGPNCAFKDFEFIDRESPSQSSKRAVRGAPRSTSSLLSP